MASDGNLNKPHVHYYIKGDVAVAKFDHPTDKVNSFSEQTCLEFEQLLDRFENDPNVKAGVVISGKLESFFVGADIRAIETWDFKKAQKMSTRGQNCSRRLREGKKPVVCAVLGPCLGAGLEMALGCHYIMAVKHHKTIFGLPEVLLGLLPGAGGTQLLPRRINIFEALNMLLTGRHVKSEVALNLNLIDRLIDPLEADPEKTLEHLEEKAIEAVQQLAKGSLSIPKPSLFNRLLMFVLRVGIIRNLVFRRAKAEAIKRSNGLYPAPLKILEVVEKGMQMGIETGFEVESWGFAELTQTPQSKQLVNVFKCQTQCKKNRFADKLSKSIANIGVISDDDVFGARLSFMSQLKKFKTIAHGVDSYGSYSNQVQVGRNLDQAIRDNLISLKQKEVYLSKLCPYLSEYKNSDLVITTLSEGNQSDIKLILKIEKNLREDCILALNPQFGSITEMAKASRRPQNVVGMHFFSPLTKTPLLEVIRTKNTSDTAVAAAVSVGLTLGKMVIVVNEGPAAYVFRLVSVLGVEALRLLKEGFDVKQVDARIKRIGFVSGSLAFMDEMGIDVFLQVWEQLTRAHEDRLGGDDVSIAKAMVSEGKRTGKGWFDYGNGQKSNKGNALHLFGGNQRKQISLSEEELKMRIICRVINEAVLCLEEGVIDSPMEGDVGAIIGFGFPPFLGGPFRYIDSQGADGVETLLDEMTKMFGKGFEPCQLLRKHATDASLKFY